MNELDDLTLIMQGKAGDTAATNALWARHQNFIRQQMAKIYDLTPAELSVLQDAERFADSLLSDISFFNDFLRSGISFATFFLGRTSREISCKRSASGFEITRLLGYVPEYEKDIILSEIKISLLSSYSDVMIETDIDMKSPIFFSVKF